MKHLVEMNWRRVALFSVAMLIIAAAANATMDTLSFRYSESIFARQPASWQHWCNPAISFQNKWKNGDRHQGEAFPLSSTALIWTTDAWHLSKSIMWSSLLLAIMAPFWRLLRVPWWAWVLIFLGLSLMRGVVFECLFRWGL